MGAAAAASQTTFLFVQAEIDPEKIRKAKEKYQEAHDLFMEIVVAYEKYGPESPEANMADINYQEWQERSRCSN